MQSAGLDHVLVNAGEIRAIGEPSPNRAWQVALEGQGQPHESLKNQALAVSSAYTPMIGDTRAHLFDTRTGKAVSHFKSVTVKAPNATLADALSTGLSVLHEEEWAQVFSNLDGLSLAVTALRKDGSFLKHIS